MKISKRKLNAMFAFVMSINLAVIIMAVSAISANYEYKLINRQLENKVTEKQQHIKNLSDEIEDLNNELLSAENQIEKLKLWEPN